MGAKKARKTKPMASTRKSFFGVLPAIGEEYSRAVRGACLPSSVRALAEDALEDVVDGVELAVQVEGAIERGGREEFGDARIGGDALAEAGVRLPGGHGVFLHPLVGLARAARRPRPDRAAAGRKRPGLAWRPDCAACVRERRACRRRCRSCARACSRPGSWSRAG